MRKTSCVCHQWGSSRLTHRCQPKASMFKRCAGRDCQPRRCGERGEPRDDTTEVEHVPLSTGWRCERQRFVSCREGGSRGEMIMMMMSLIISNVVLFGRWRHFSGTSSSYFILATIHHKCMRFPNSSFNALVKATDGTRGFSLGGAMTLVYHRWQHFQSDLSVVFA